MRGASQIASKLRRNRNGKMGKSNRRGKNALQRGTLRMQLSSEAHVGGGKSGAERTTDASAPVPAHAPVRARPRSSSATLRTRHSRRSSHSLLPRRHPAHEARVGGRKSGVERTTDASASTQARGFGSMKLRVSRFHEITVPPVVRMLLLSRSGFHDFARRAASCVLLDRAAERVPVPGVAPPRRREQRCPRSSALVSTSSRAEGRKLKSGNTAAARRRSPSAQAIASVVVAIRQSEQHSAVLRGREETALDAAQQRRTTALEEKQRVLYLT